MSHDLAESVRREQRAWANSESIEFFQNHRSRTEELYPSEWFFLPEVVRRSASCLDVGCAAGGFSRIMKSFNPALQYTGVDVNPEFVQLACERYPGDRFVVGDGIHFATPPESFDLVHSSGILHLNSCYVEIVRACYEQTRRLLLCDFRMTRGPALVGSMRLDFGGTVVAGELPYFVVNVDELLDLLKSLTPMPRLIRCRGYYHPPSAAALLPLNEVLMAFFLIEKGRGDGPPRVELELP